jgi:hypothetical protein
MGCGNALSVLPHGAKCEHQREHEVGFLVFFPIDNERARYPETTKSARNGFSG